MRIALSIRQPWAWLIVNGHKDVENRDWPTSYLGPVLIHASKTRDLEGYGQALHICELLGITLPPLDDLPKGGIVGASVFVTTAPCIECAKRLEGARVKEVLYRDIYKNEDGLEHLRKAGIHVERISNENSSEGS